ncbi:MAG: nucleotidyltransferase domain-containing protein [Candidatus Thiodiazotropha sp. (ex Dulcina madagascariensis)]|nr:nucleotidyltransferase domain-containing protein [Candidatus Thiodiazotropha sp. (ex Dulcina madagascariensis)]
MEMIILFGSHARGDWVEDQYEEDHITYEYRSDFDILIVTADKGDERDIAYDNDLKAALQPGPHGTRVNYIVHTIQHVNQMLAERRFFFMDILNVTCGFVSTRQQPL